MTSTEQTGQTEQTGGRVVIVTGGSRGLGAGIVRSYLAEGDLVATCSRSRTDEVDAWASDPATAASSSSRPTCPAWRTPRRS